VAAVRPATRPGVADLAADREPVRGEATVGLRMAAVVAFYEFMAEEGLGPELTLHRAARKRIDAGQPYKPFLHHLAPRRPATAPVFRLRRSRRDRPPLLTPSQVDALLNACARWDAAAGAWRGSLRNRLLFALLAETGMRLGEALCLFHDDVVAGRGGTPYVLVTPREHPHQQRVRAAARGGSTSPTGWKPCTASTCGMCATAAARRRCRTWVSGGCSSTSPGRRCSRRCARRPSTTRCGGSKPASATRCRRSSRRTGYVTHMPAHC
jgi:hypothetical protein